MLMSTQEAGVARSRRAQDSTLVKPQALRKPVPLGLSLEIPVAPSTPLVNEITPTLPKRVGPQQLASFV
jgi:hypothetical protein